GVIDRHGVSWLEHIAARRARPPAQLGGQSVARGAGEVLYIEGGDVRLDDRDDSALDWLAGRPRFGDATRHVGVVTGPPAGCPHLRSTLGVHDLRVLHEVALEPSRKPLEPERPNAPSTAVYPCWKRRAKTDCACPTPAGVSARTYPRC